MKTFINPEINIWPEILKRPLFDVSGLYEKVQVILNEIKQKGDSALFKYTFKFDKVELPFFQVSEAEIIMAENLINIELKEAISLASLNIKKFHAAQKTEIKKIETMPGVTCWQKAVPIEKV